MKNYILPFFICCLASFKLSAQFEHFDFFYRDKYSFRFSSVYFNDSLKEVSQSGLNLKVGWTNISLETRKTMTFYNVAKKNKTSLKYVIKIREPKMKMILRPYEGSLEVTYSTYVSWKKCKYRYLYHNNIDIYNKDKEEFEKNQKEKKIPKKGIKSL